MDRAALLNVFLRGRGLAAALVLHGMVASLLLTWHLVSPVTDYPAPILIEIVEAPEVEEPEEVAPTQPAASIASPMPPPEPAERSDEPSPEPVEVQTNPLPRTEITASPVTGHVSGPEVPFPNSPEFDAATRTVRALFCARLNPDQRVHCPDKALDDETVAVLVADARAAEEMFSQYAAFAIEPTTKELARRRQQRAYAERQVGVGATSTGDTASSGTVQHLNAYPDPLWDGYRDPSWNDY